MAISACMYTVSLIFILTIADFPPQLVNMTHEGVSTAGYSGYTLSCTTSREEDLNPSSTLTLQWLDPDGIQITSGDRFTISGNQGPSRHFNITSRLTFNSLYTSQAGIYTCRTLLTITGTIVDHTVTHNFTVTVKCKSTYIRNSVFFTAHLACNM